MRPFRQCRRPTPFVASWRLPLAAIFVSYRKQGEDKARALHLTEDLREAFGSDAVFLDDRATILGKFGGALDAQLRACRALIVVIGPTWIERLEDLSAPGDWVHREIETGLQRGILIVPVLVDGANMPQRKQLPPALTGLLDFQAMPIYTRHWKENVEVLTDALAEELGLRRARPAVAVPTLSGDWIDTDGVQVTLVHQGNNVQISLMAGGRRMGRGNATLDGNQVQLSIWRADLGEGSGTGTVSPDGRQISGSVQYGFQRFGFSISRRR
jgi:hypothetical protein